MVHRIWAGLVLTLIAGVSTAFSEEAPPSFTCKGYGHAFTCAAANIEQYKLLPEWIYHKKGGKYKSYGTHFHYMAKKDPVLLEMRVYLDDQSEAPYDGVLYKQALVWVRLCGNRAKFGRVIEGQPPPECK